MDIFNTNELNTSKPMAITIETFDQTQLISKYEYLKKMRESKYPNENFKNSFDEIHILEYAECFRRQFVQLFPKRPDLLLSAQNEFGIKVKIIILLKTEQKENSMHSKNLEICVHFNSTNLAKTHDNMEFGKMCKISLLEIRNGDSLDFSIFLVSLLRGSGYDAYVVSGFAAKDTTLCTQSSCSCPEAILNQTKWVSPEESSNIESKFEIPSHYQIPDRTVKPTTFSECLKEKEKSLENQKINEVEKANAVNIVEKSSIDPLERQRVHFWVLVRAGCRYGLKKN
ncbi:hypothetical protein RFI_11303 [Reticulomyxa filosa]|uniref:Uncharacterized protein n=1 Tax=Reticulomyxa filosa TaxID=46433 RepID=X6NJB8_RETFI|nr:hypothetical protein RFI_11303 [Reticulomyxa filosa]|eukprot:ETO25834.1 hypothetical protein RFI_11303 [Reticulomyxa filosa]